MSSAGTEVDRPQAAIRSQDALDRTCRQMLEANADRVQVVEAAGDAEREACFRLRYECAVEQGWVAPEAFPDGLEQDEYDEDAVHLCAWTQPEPAETVEPELAGTVEQEPAETVEPELAGTVRLVFPRPGFALPIEAEFGIELSPPGRAVDGGRLVVASGHRASFANQVLATLFSRCWLVARERGLSHFASVAPDRVLELYRSSGLEIEALGEPREFWGQERRPIMLTGFDPDNFFPGAW